MRISGSPTVNESAAAVFPRSCKVGSRIGRLVRWFKPENLIFGRMRERITRQTNG